MYPHSYGYTEVYPKFIISYITITLYILFLKGEELLLEFVLTFVIN